jgi:hypothetical protein
VEVPLCVALGFYHRLADYQSSGSTMSEYAIRGMPSAGDRGQPQPLRLAGNSLRLYGNPRRRATIILRAVSAGSRRPICCASRRLRRRGEDARAALLC